MKLSRFATDKSKEENGVWVDAGEGLKLLVARSNSPKYLAHIKAKGKPYARQLRLGTVGDGVIEGITQEAVAQHLLLGWENLTDDQGEAIPYSSGKALELFKSHPDFYNMVLEFAQDQSLFRESEQDEVKENLTQPSTGT